MATESPSGAAVLRRATRGQRGPLSLACLLASGHQAGEALVPVLIGVAIDAAVATGSATSLLRWLVVLAAVFLGLSLSFRFAARAAERAAERAAHTIRVELSTRILDVRGGGNAGLLPGELVNIATSDAKRVGGVNGVLPFGFAAVAGVLVSAIVLLRMSVPLGLLVLLGTPPLLWLAHLIGRPLERRSEAEQERAARASGVAADLVYGLRILKGIGAERAATDRYHRTSQDSLAATLRAARARSWHDGGVLALTGIFIAVVALLGGRLAAEGAISIGELIAAVGLAQFLLGPFQVFAWVNGELAQGRASAGRIASVLAAAPATASGRARLPAQVRGRVRLEGLRYGRVRGLDLTVDGGELLGIVATDPGCANDLLDCLAREADPESGSIELDGIPLSELDPMEARRAILVAPHDAPLFEGSISENVHSDDTEQSTHDSALAAAGIGEMAGSLPEGMDTELGERGGMLSGGQRQRVALARALATDAPVLVLHDPTTAVDAVTEARVATELASLRAGRTTILITTSPALLANTDRVIVLDGALRGEGRHADLVQEQATYRAAVLS